MDFCEKCHQALDGSGLFEYGYGQKGALPPKTEPRDVPWIFLVGAILLWGIGIWAIASHLLGRTNKGSNPGWSFYLIGLGTVSFAKYLHEKRLPAGK